MVRGPIACFVTFVAMLAMLCGCSAKQQPAPVENVPSLCPPEPVVEKVMLPAPKAIDAPPPTLHGRALPAASAHGMDSIVNMELNRNCLGDPTAFLRAEPTTRGVE